MGRLRSINESVWQIFDHDLFSQETRGLQIWRCAFRSVRLHNDARSKTTMTLLVPYPCHIRKISREERRNFRILSRAANKLSRLSLAGQQEALETALPSYLISSQAKRSRQEVSRSLRTLNFFRLDEKERNECNLTKWAGVAFLNRKRSII